LPGWFRAVAIFVALTRHALIANGFSPSGKRLRSEL
jgi:hypothetical protein